MKTGPTTSPDELGAAHGSPFAVPPFDAQWNKPEVRFFWWSWHPNYPSWSRYGGKGYETQDEAWEQRAKDTTTSTLDYYHNKLVREGDGAFTVVADDPCRKLDVWRAIKAKMEAAPTTTSTDTNVDADANNATRHPGESDSCGTATADNKPNQNAK